MQKKKMTGVAYVGNIDLWISNFFKQNELVNWDNSKVTWNSLFLCIEIIEQVSSQVTPKFLHLQMW
jgi:hypothetical protein